MKCASVLLAITCLLSAVTAQYWTGPYKLSDSMGGINPSACKEWLWGNVTCMVWQSYDGRQWDILSKPCSFQNGNGWGAAMLVSGQGGGVNPAVACFNDGVSGSPSFCCAYERRTSTTGDIYAAFDTVGGPWSSRTVIGPCTNTDGDSARPQVMTVRHGNLYDTAWVTWTNHDTSGSYVEYSYNAGDSWGTPMIAVAQANPIHHARLGRGHHGLYDGCPLLTWESNSDIYYSEYLSGSWQAPQEVAHSAALDRNPDVVSYSLSFGIGPWVVWESARDGDTAIFGTAEDTFSIAWRLCDTSGSGSNHAPCGTPAEYPIDYGHYLAAWVSDRDGNTNIYSGYSLVPNEDRYVDRDPADDVNPTLTTLGETMNWCLWQSNRSGNWDIWGSYDYSTGVTETPNAGVRTANGGATIMRRLPAGAVAFDAMGRRVMSARPGVYFVVTPHPDPLPQGERGRSTGSAVSVRKVVVQQ